MKKKKSLILGISLAIIAIFAGVIISLFYYAFSPENVAKQYVKAIAKRDFEKAFDYVELPQNDFFKREVFARFMAGETDEIKTDIKNITASKKKQSSPMITTVTVKYKKDLGDAISTENLKLRLQKDKTAFVFNRYKVMLFDDVDFSLELDEKEKQGLALFCKETITALYESAIMGRTDEEMIEKIKINPAFKDDIIDFYHQLKKDNYNGKDKFVKLAVMLENIPTFSIEGKARAQLYFEYETANADAETMADDIAVTAEVAVMDCQFQKSSGWELNSILLPEL